MFASPSSKGLLGFGLNGQRPVACLAVLARLGTTAGCVIASAGAMLICGSGMTCATAGLVRNDATAAADSVAATALGSVNCNTFVPPAALIAATTEAWFDSVAVFSARACVRSFMLECCALSTTITGPPLAAPSGAGAATGPAVANDTKPIPTITASAEPPATPARSRREPRNPCPARSI